MKKFLIALAALIPFLTGCFLIDQKTVILWTNIPETAVYVELYNASQTDFRVELVYAEDPSEYQRLVSDGAPDIVLSQDLASSAIIEAFSPLDKLIEKGRINEESLYTDLYSICKKEHIMVLPVSFNLPAIMYRQDSISRNPSGLKITPDQLKAESEVFNKSDTERFRVTGFAPSWDADFLLYNAFAAGSDFSETEDGNLIWNDSKLAESIDFCREWTEKINSGYQEEEDFTITYCYDPGYKLLNTGRIGYYYTDLRSFFTIPAEDRSTLEFNWLGSDTGIPVCEDIVYIGIPNRSRKKKTAAEFIVWMMNEDTQKMLLESSQFKRSRGFGICGGLSSVINVNEFIMPTFYKRLIGKIPPQEYLNFPSNLPAEWQDIRSDVIIPWLLDQSSENPETGTLPDMLKTWILQEQQK